MKVLLASHNQGKIAELQALLRTSVPDAEVVSMADIGFFEEIKESGTTFEENALIKSRTGARLGYITVADDSGLEVDALDGAPGVYSARYAGEDCDSEKEQSETAESARRPAESAPHSAFRFGCRMFLSGWAHGICGARGMPRTNFRGTGWRGRFWVRSVVLVRAGRKILCADERRGKKRD